jgi:hypothetical protein
LDEGSAHRKAPLQSTANTKRRMHIHALSGIRTWDLSVVATEYRMCLRPHGLCYRLLFLLLSFFIIIIIIIIIIIKLRR